MKAKPFEISKEIVWNAFKRVKANQGSAGIDNISIQEFETDLKGNLYKVWNRMSSGSYFPPPVKLVEIPKKSGGKRPLGIPTVSDRVAQMVVKLQIEPEMERLFHQDSYGYRPKKSAHDAIGVLKKRCWKYKWVLEFDIKGAFDNIDHNLLMKAVDKHVQDKWARLYIHRWLTASYINADGTKTIRKNGTPQGGVISPVLMNLFMHYAFDAWMVRNYSGNPFVRYADDGVISCSSEREAQAILRSLTARFNDCKMEIHPNKTKIADCRCIKGVGRSSNQQFTFLGFTFRPRSAKRKDGLRFTSFQPASSMEAKKELRQKIRHLNIPRWTNYTIEEISKRIGPMLRGWWNYFGKFYGSDLIQMSYYLDLVISKWVRRKYKKFRYQKRTSAEWIRRVSKRSPHLFPHWENRWKNVRYG